MLGIQLYHLPVGHVEALQSIPAQDLYLFLRRKREVPGLNAFCEKAFLARWPYYKTEDAKIVDLAHDISRMNDPNVSFHPKLLPF